MWPANGAAQLTAGCQNPATALRTESVREGEAPAARSALAASIWPLHTAWVRGPCPAYRDSVSDAGGGGGFRREERRIASACIGSGAAVSGTRDELRACCRRGFGSAPSARSSGHWSRRGPDPPRGASSRPAGRRPGQPSAAAGQSPAHRGASGTAAKENASGEKEEGGAG